MDSFEYAVADKANFFFNYFSLSRKLKKSSTEKVFGLAGMINLNYCMEVIMIIYGYVLHILIMFA